jgi:hypothetical protein
MFQWYQSAQVCYAYLSDVPGGDQEQKSYSAFRKSKWFFRGWTLQELLAPDTVIFFDEDWNEIGTKASLKNHISSVTGIRDIFGYKFKCVAMKMSWASRRETTRVEDQAYCLMGIFGVNMPTLYGEGERAFYRLQLEIMNTSPDDSIFAWDLDHGRYEGADTGLLATSPAAFGASGDIDFNIIARNRRFPSPFSMTNKGLQMEVGLIPYAEDMSEGETYSWMDFSKKTFRLPLNCCRESECQKPDPEYIMVRLGQYSATEDLYYRAQGATTSAVLPLDNVGEPINYQKRIIFVKQQEFLSPKIFPDTFSIDAQVVVRQGMKPQMDLFNDSFVNFSIEGSDDSPTIRVLRQKDLFNQSVATLVFSNGTSGFALAVRAPFWTVEAGTEYEGRAGIEIFFKLVGQPFDEFIRTVYRRTLESNREFAEKRSKSLPSGDVLTAVLRKKAQGDAALYVITLTVTAGLRKNK